MKVEIVSDKGTETIDIQGNTIFPYYINVLNIQHYSDKIVFRMTGKYKTRITAEYDAKNDKSDDRLWIMGENVKPVTDGGEEEKIM